MPSTLDAMANKLNNDEVTDPVDDNEDLVLVQERGTGTPPPIPSLANALLALTQTSRRKRRAQEC